MLYPDFNDLLALKDRKLNLRHFSNRAVTSSVTGNHLSPFRGQGLEFDSVREYVPGDDIRNIDWRVTARTGSPHLKLFKEDREKHIVIGVDVNASMRFGTRKTFKSIQAAYVAALLGWQGIAQQDPVSACLFGDVQEGMRFFKPNRTRKSLCTILKTLSEPPIAHHHIPLENAAKLMDQEVYPGSLVYLISDFMDIDKNFQNQSISRLSKKCEVVLIAVNDAADQMIYPLGTLGFSSQGKEKIVANTNYALGREAYAAQWKENREQLYALTKRLKISLVELTTESDINRDLALGLKKIARRKVR